MSETGLTRDLCQIIRATTFESLGDECVQRVKQAIKDGIAVAVAGCKAPQIAISVAHMRSLGGAPQASVWGWGFKASVVQAAYINGCATHVLDFEPMWSPPTHSISSTVPVAVALAEVQPVTGKQLLTAVAKGMEIQGRLQYAGNQYVAEHFKFHPPGVSGVIGSAVVAADLLGLELQGMQHAIGLAASRAGSLLANIGSMTKCTHCGTAAASGLDAALLAKRGFTANPDVIEAPKGLADIYYGESFDPAKLLAYGRPYRVVDPGLAIKLFPSQYATHYVISAALEVAPQITDKTSIVRLRVIAPALKHLDRPNPIDGLEGKHSLQYVAAAALLDDAVRIDTFMDERRFRKDVVDLLARTELVMDASIPLPLDKMHMGVEVILSDGRTLRATCRAPKGTWGVPVEPRDHRAKLEDCFGRILVGRQVAEVIDLLDHIEELDATGIRKIVALIAGSDTLR